MLQVKEDDTYSTIEAMQYALEVMSHSHENEA